MMPETTKNDKQSRNRFKSLFSASLAMYSLLIPALLCVIAAMLVVSWLFGVILR